MNGTMVAWLSAALMVALLVSDWYRWHAAGTTALALAIGARLAFMLYYQTRPRYENDADSHTTLGLSGAGAKTPAFDHSWPD